MMRDVILNQKSSAGEMKPVLGWVCSVTSERAAVVADFGYDSSGIDGIEYFYFGFQMNFEIGGHLGEMECYHICCCSLYCDRPMDRVALEAPCYGWRCYRSS